MPSELAAAKSLQKQGQHRVSWPAPAQATAGQTCKFYQKTKRPRILLQNDDIDFHLRAMQCVPAALLA